MIIRKDLLKLVPPSDKILHLPPEPYVFSDKEEPLFITNVLFEKMQELGGVGLSANQLGLNYKIFVMGLDNIRFNVFNPKIIEYSKEESSFSEGCLTYPGISIDIRRPIWIEVEYQNINSGTIRERLSGLTARVFQHEYDHMMGITFQKRVSSMKWAMAVKKFKNKKEKIVKKYAKKILVDIAKNSENRPEV